MKTIILNASPRKIGILHSYSNQQWMVRKIQVLKWSTLIYMI